MESSFALRRVYDRANKESRNAGRRRFYFSCLPAFLIGSSLGCYAIANRGFGQPNWQKKKASGFTPELMTKIRDFVAGTLGQHADCGLDARQEAPGSDEPLDSFQVAMQGAVASQGPNVLADMSISGLD